MNLSEIPSKIRGLTLGLLGIVVACLAQWISSVEIGVSLVGIYVMAASFAAIKWGWLKREDIGWQLGNRKKTAACTVLLSVAVLAVNIYILLYKSFTMPSTSMSYAVLSITLAPLWEETLFRGCGVLCFSKCLKEHRSFLSCGYTISAASVSKCLKELGGIVADWLLKWNAFPWVVIVASIFSVLHFHPGSTCSLFVFGILSGCAALHTRSLVPSIVAHAVHNLFAVCAVLGVL